MLFTIVTKVYMLYYVYKLVERVTFAKQTFSQNFEQRQHYKRLYVYIGTSHSLMMKRLV